MTKYTPIPEHLSTALSVGARRFLEHERVRSCEALLALGEGDMLRFVGCGKKMLAVLKGVQRRVIEEYPGLLPQYTAPLPVVPGNGPQGSNPASAPLPSCGPADWSILNRTLPDLFQLPSLPPYGEPASEAAISTLGLPAADLESLRSVAVFPEDQIHILGSLSLGYLSRAGLGDAALSIMQTALAGLHGLAGPALPSLVLAQVRDSSLYAGIAPDLQDLLDSLVVPDFPRAILPETRTDCRPPAVPWSTIAEITERTVIQRLGLCSEALRAIGHLWLLRERAESVRKSTLAGLPSSAYGDFYRLADTYLDLALDSVSSKEYIDGHRRMLRGRLRLADGRKWTLSELGKREGVTRERARQVEFKVMGCLKSQDLLKHLGYFWQLVDHLLDSGGGVLYLSELAVALAEILGWPSTPGEALAAIVDLSPNYQVNWDDPIRVVLAGNCCARCAAIGAGVAKAVEAAPDGKMSFEAALETARQSCRNSRCPELGKIAGFSGSILHCVADATPGISVRDEQLVAPHARSQEASRNLQEILLKAGKAMHFKDILLEHDRMLPTSPMTAVYAYRMLAESPFALLWGRGAFIHRDLVSVPRPLIAEIQEGLEKRLEKRLDSLDAPYLCLNGTIFDHYRERLRSECVDTPLALYSCMRLVGSATLDFSEYPYVQRKDAPAPRPTLSAVLEDFLLDRPGPVSWVELRGFGMIVMGMVHWQFTLHLGRAPGVLQIGTRGYFLHRSHLSLVLDALTEITGEPREFGGTVQQDVRWLYHHNVARCNAAGIKSVACLTALLRHFFRERYGSLRFLSETSAEDRPERKKRINGAKGSLREKTAKIPPPPRPVPVTRQVEKYLENRAGPCKTSELFDQFRDRIKSTKYLFNDCLTNKEKILWYTRNSFIARQALGWDAGKQAEIEEFATRHLERRTRSGKPFGLCSEIFRERGGTLPAIAEHLLWTPVLLQQLLGSGKRFVAIGRQRDIFVAADNPHGITTVDDIMFHSLVNDYGGIARKKQFSAAMRGSGFTFHQLTKLLKGRDCRVVVNDGFIAAVGLEAPKTEPE